MSQDDDTAMNALQQHLSEGLTPPASFGDSIDAKMVSEGASETFGKSEEQREEEQPKEDQPDEDQPDEDQPKEDQPDEDQPKEQPEEMNTMSYDIADSDNKFVQKRFPPGVESSMSRGEPLQAPEKTLKATRSGLLSLLPSFADKNAPIDQLEEVKVDVILNDALFTEKYKEAIAQEIAERSTSGNETLIKDEVKETSRIIGHWWRSIFKNILVWCTDPVNALRISRPLQLQLDYLGPHEALVLGNLIEALDDVINNEAGAKQNLRSSLEQALQIRNVGRTLVQNFGPFNVLWHLYFQTSNIRSFTIASSFTLTSFPPSSENSLSTKRHVVNSILRKLLGPGRYITRLVTGGREEFIVDDDQAIAQNLAAESTGFEEAMRQQYGNYFGRLRINEYRLDHRLPTDESVVRTFTTQPEPTLINNGVVHVLRAVSRHWESILNNPFGVFGNQRMEMLDVALSLRFHMPIVLLTLANLRGLNSWDTHTLGPLMKDLMNHKIGEDMTNACLLIDRLEDAAQNVCGGVMSRVGPMTHWLKQIRRASLLMEVEKVRVKSIVESVSVGIEAGHHLAKATNWKSPSDAEMFKSILVHIKLDKAKAVLNLVENSIADEEIGMPEVHPTSRSENDALRQKQIDHLSLLSFKDIDPIIGLIAKVGSALSYEVATLKHEVVKEAGETGLSEPIKEALENRKYRFGDKVRTQLSSIHRKLANDILSFIEADLSQREVNRLSDEVCKRALGYVTPRDKRTLIEMILNGLEKDRSAILLLGRTTTLLERELRRQELDHQIMICSKNNAPFAESIIRAQKAFLTIELDCTRKFPYNAFMEFEDLRSNLMKLQVISQIQCQALDDAKLQRLVSIHKNCNAEVYFKDLKVGVQYFVERSPQKYKCVRFDGNNVDGSLKIFKVPPQNTLVVGGGPSGLLTSLHCLENCLKTGGNMKLYESRDAFEKAGGTYERAQVVRLDSRWVRMLRYHLGTSFEDVWVPASGETDAHLGNTLPTQGFIEITIKDLENVLHLEISKLWSLDLLDLYSKSNASFDYKGNVMTKRGDALKVDDLVKLRIDKNGKDITGCKTWRVINLELHETVDHMDLSLDETYQLYGREFISAYGGLKSVRLVAINKRDPENPMYTFEDRDEGIVEEFDANRFPTIYDDKNYGFKNIIFECIENGRKLVVDFSQAKKEKYVMDVGQTNIIFATGKPAKYSDHLKITPEEPYGVCCIQGLKISLNMHNFGEKRWGDGIVNDIRSQTEQNTRVVGDFTKSVSVVPIVKEMIRLLSDNERTYDWKREFDDVLEDASDEILESLGKLNPSKWRRQYLQTRFFETGDNFYLGMEFNREYDVWKKEIVHNIVEGSTRMRKVTGTISNSIDRLWYEAAFEVISQGDVYNPSGSAFIPKVYLINAKKNVHLNTLKIGDSFRISRAMDQKYEVLIPGDKKIWVRSVEGYLYSLEGDENVLREADLTRSPDGNTESKVAIATFPVAHLVSHRTVSVQQSKHWCTFPIGDAQSSPHFMRYSGLTGAAINSMLINNYIGAGLNSSTVFTQDRAMQLSQETNWSNEEVVRRGTGGNFGDDGFLRPGFKYTDMAEYLYYKAIEMDVYEEGVESQVPLTANTLCDSLDSRVDAMFQNAMLKKFASALVPRGMELMISYLNAVETSMSTAILNKILVEMKCDEHLTNEAAFLAEFQLFADEVIDMTAIKGDGALMSKTKSRWSERFENLFDAYLPSSKLQEKVREYMTRAHIMVDIVRKSYLVARDDHINGTRISSEAENEPKSVDYLVVDLAVEAKSFANGLGTSALLATISLGLTNSSVSIHVTIFWTILVAFVNVFVAFGTMTNVSRYQNRNEEFRTEFLSKKMPRVERSLFKTLSPSARNRVTSNPISKQLQNSVQDFKTSAEYYGVSCDEILSLYIDLETDRIESVENLMEKIRSYFIPIVYHKETYLKDSLLKVHNAAGELLDLLQDIGGNGEADDLFVMMLEKLPTYNMRLQNSLQTGPIKYGFRREGKPMRQCIIFAPFRYWLFRICNALFSGNDASCWLPVSTVTKSMCINIQKCNEYIGGNKLKCEARDLKELFYATMESAHASTVYFVACLSFTFALLSTTINLVTAIVIRTQSISRDELPAWLDLTRRCIQGGSAVASIFAALCALEYFIKLLYHQRKVIIATEELPQGISKTVGKVTYIARLQSFISLSRALAAALSVSALACGFIFNLSEDLSPWGVKGTGLLWLAEAAISSWFIASFVSIYTIFFPLWNLGPKASQDICNHFKSKLIEIYISYGESNDEESVIRDYTAREFLSKTRFDSSLGADRLSAIMQTILSQEFNLDSTGRNISPSKEGKKVP